MDSPFSLAPSLSVSPGSSSISSLQPSPQPDILSIQPDIATAFDIAFDALALDSYSLGEPYIDPTAVCSSIDTTTEDFPWFGGSEFFPDIGDSTFSEDHGYHHCHGFDEQATGFDVLLSPGNIAAASPRTSTYQSLGMETRFNLYTDSPAQPLSSADLDLYLGLFFSAFCKQIPLVHAPTWTMEDKPLFLVRAMQACGALFMRTTASIAFIDEVLSSTRDALVSEFNKSSIDAREQNHLLLVLVLLQTIGLFHHNENQRTLSNFYHGMLVMMIRRTGVIPRVNAWVPSDLSDMQFLGIAWREWANYEMIKRVLFLSYLHDCCRCMYFAVPPSFQPSDLNICLPCDDALWTAPDAAGWFNASQTSSPYGVGSPRILGFPMQTALTILSDTRISNLTLAFNPFAQFILIHTILRNIYASPFNHVSVPSLVPAPEIDPSVAELCDINSFAVQVELRNWLQTWLGSPESTSVENSEEPPFVQNAFPFYWLAQVSLLMVQDGLIVLGGQLSEEKGEERFRRLEKWLDHINTFLKSRNGRQPPLWDELLKLQGEMSLEDVQRRDEHPNGLLSFFLGSGT
ncbi:hypothetical protein C0992_008978 [Termitomyces sp. T32_za158]|nr:hypothetical protein C0992_008978 [Termitomyces sp. T32_za158]